jgi:formate-dependent nitrite reductase membrane component NrfD
LNLGYGGASRLLEVASPLVALAFTGLTTLLLILDLKRPERFFYILLKPNLKSWLVWGGYILFAYGLLAALWLFYGITRGKVPDMLLGLTALLAIASACYSAFLFAQAKGRDLWQSPLFFWHLFTQAVTAGSATLLILGALAHASPARISLLGKVLYASLVIDLAMTLGEISLGHASENVSRAIAHLKEGALSGRFWWLAVGLGNLAPLLLLMWVGLQDGAGFIPAALAGGLALIGLWFFEDLWIKAGQSVPLS